MRLGRHALGIGPLAVALQGQTLPQSWRVASPYIPIGYGKTAIRLVARRGLDYHYHTSYSQSVALVTPVGSIYAQSAILLGLKLYKSFPFCTGI